MPEADPLEDEQSWLLIGDGGKTMSPRLALQGATAWCRTVADRPWIVWLTTRTLALCLGWLAFAMVRGNVFFDTTYYGRWAHGTLLGYRFPYRDFAWEYPPGALPAMALPGLFAPLFPGRHAPHAYLLAYGVLWVVFMLLVDAAVTWFLLVRTLGAGRHPATVIWLYGPPLLGALAWARYDLLPAAASLVAVVAAGVGRERTAGGLAGVGGALKIWPLLLTPLQRSRRSALAAMSTAGAVIATAALITRVTTGDWGFGQVLRYQSRRGLQVESFPALPVMWLQHAHVAGYSTRFRFGAWEVLGPHVSVLSQLATAGWVAGLTAVALLHWRFMRDDAGARLVALSAMSVLLVTLVTDKVLSPQYLLWLLAVLAAACVLDPDTWRPYVPWVLAVTVSTGAVFPWLYDDILGTAWLGLVVMTVRDLILLGIAVAVARRMLVELRFRRRTGRAGSARGLVHE